MSIPAPPSQGPHRRVSARHVRRGRRPPGCTEGGKGVTDLTFTSITLSAGLLAGLALRAALAALSRTRRVWASLPVDPGGSLHLPGWPLLVLTAAVAIGAAYAATALSTT